MKFYNRIFPVVAAIQIPEEYTPNPYGELEKFMGGDWMVRRIFQSVERGTVTIPNPGEWVVRSEDGTYSIYSDALFRRVFQDESAGIYYPAESPILPDDLKT